MVNIPPSHALYHSWLQCEGAKRDLDWLDGLIAGYKSNPLRITTEKSDGETIFRWPPPIPDSWGTVVSNIASELRASINYIAWQLAVKNLAGRRAPSTNVQFPICDDPGDTRGGFQYQLSKQLANVLPSAIPDFEYFQPYHRSDRPETYLLAVLREISNSTKHRFLVQPQSGMTAILQGAGQIGVALDDGNPRIVVSRTNENGITEELKPTLSHQIGIQIPTLTPANYDIAVLNGIYDLVRDSILPRFTGYF